MSARQEPGDKAAIRAAIDARLEAEKLKLEKDPEAQRALASLRDAQAKEKVYPLPQTAIEDAQELLAKIEAKPVRKDTLREPIGKALQPEHPVALRPITRKLSLADQAAGEIVEPVRRLTAAGSRDETLVGGRSLKTEEGEARPDDTTQGGGRALWLGLFAIAACVIAIIVWKAMTSAPATNPASSATGDASESGAAPVPATSPAAPRTTSTPDLSADASAPVPPITVAVPTSSPPIATSAPAPHTSAKPTTSSSTTPAVSASVRDPFTHFDGGNR